MKSTAASVLFTVAALGAGVLLGRYLRGRGPTGTSTSTEVGAMPSGPDGTPLASAIRGADFQTKLGRALAQASPSLREELLFRLGESLAPSEIPQALAILATRHQPGALELARHLLGRWAESDPASAMKYAMAMPQSARREKALDVVLNEWLAGDASGALQWAKALPPGSRRNRCLQAVLTAVAASDPARALGLVKSLGNLQNATAIQEAILRQWATADPVAAATAARGMKWLSRDILGHLAGQWAVKDPKAALAWAGGLLSPQARRSALDAAMGAWADSDVQAAAMYATNLPPEERLDAVGSLAQRLALTNMEAALSWATNLPPGLCEKSALGKVVQVLAKESPAAAAALWGGMSDTDQRDLAGGAGAGWYKQDPAATMAWVNTLSRQAAQQAAYGIFAELKNGDPSKAANFAMALSDNGLRWDYLGQAAALYAGKDLAAARNWVSQMPSGPDKTSALQGLVQAWAGADPQAAAQFAQSLSSDEFTSALASGLAGKWAAADPAAALAWAQSLPSGSMQASAVVSAVKSWASQSPKDAAAYVALLPTGPAQNEALSDVVTAWANSDPKAAADWVNTFAPGDAFDQAANTVLSRWAVDDPEAAARWAGSLPQGALSSGSAGKILFTWLNKDPQAASAWVDSCGINPNDLMSGIGESVGLPPPEVRNVIEFSHLSDRAKQELLGGGQ